MERKLTPQQDAFLSVLFTEADGDLEEAARIAGYAGPKQAVYYLVKHLRKEIAELAEMHLAKYGPAAAKALVETMNNPSEMASNIKLNAATQILDRIGVVKKEQLTVTGDQQIGIFILPPKDVRNADGTTSSGTE